MLNLIIVLINNVEKYKYTPIDNDITSCECETYYLLLKYKLYVNCLTCFRRDPTITAIQNWARSCLHRMIIDQKIKRLWNNKGLPAGRKKLKARLRNWLYKNVF